VLTGNETVTILRRASGARDEYGLPAVTETEITVDGVLVGFDSTDEPVSDMEDPQMTALTLYFPVGTVILPNDEFAVRGDVFVKAGRQQDWNSPFAGFEAGVVVKVRQRLG
jgi:hypothetical protein